MKTITLNSYSDPGHGWLKVPFTLLESLDIADQISASSYMLGDNVYLEEDCDLSLFIRECDKAGIVIKMRHSNSNNTSAIRTYPHYTEQGFKNKPLGVVGECIEYGNVRYIITHTLYRRGYQIRSCDTGVNYRLPRKSLSFAQLVK